MANDDDLNAEELADHLHKAKERAKVPRFWRKRWLSLTALWKKAASTAAIALVVAVILYIAQWPGNLWSKAVTDQARAASIAAELEHRVDHASRRGNENARDRALAGLTVEALSPELKGRGLKSLLNELKQVGGPDTRRAIDAFWGEGRPAPAPEQSDLEQLREIARGVPRRNP